MCVFLLSAGIPACAATPDPAAISVVVVNISQLQFQPEKVTVAPGTRVVWKNLDAVDHDVTSGKSVTGRKARGMKQTKFPDGRFASGLFGKGGTFAVTFDKPGEYEYYCNVHPFMTGKILVLESSAESSAESVAMRTP